MRSKIFSATICLAIVLAVSTVVTNGDVGPLVRQSARVYLNEPTMIGSIIVKGPVVFTHDNTKETRGEPCTTVYLFEPGTGRGEVIASFHCIPRSRPVVHKFTVTTEPNAALGFGCLLTEFQFAGDPEAHGVPGSTLNLVSAEVPSESVYGP
jgi:hypothetical protein